MAACHDMLCPDCQRLFADMPAYSEGTKCGKCGGTLEIYWNHAPRNARALDPKETTVVYEHPESGKIVYPGRNDTEMPERYKRRGFERRELTSLDQVDKFSKAHNVLNERAHFDRGSGRGHEAK